ncbi:immunoglobulin domain-containing family protein [Pseudochryseolinea flava]|uniref:Uncharacterized protein n=1 Tax=Pseudochryseolinea flava TaxID=2059302 RepID=A0A364XZJ2_9BACT|nr:hypothetical protein [Pseudochryseolinea flava]RAV98882.1 hypothetical protein DQQ10_21510 [Pseudochryseolinea flava]
MKNQKIKVGIFVCFFLVSLTIIGYNFLIVAPQELEDDRIFNKWYRQSFNHSFKGIITSYEEKRNERGNQYAIVDLDLISSDISQYPPDTSTVYFCRIYDRKARVMIPILNNLGRLSTEKQDIVRISDTLIFDGDRDEFKLISRGKSTIFKSISVSTNRAFRERRNADLR